MFEKLKEVKLHITISAVLTTALGIVLIIWPGEVASAFGRLFAVALFIAGVILMALSVKGFKLGIPPALMLLIVGIWSFANPKALTSILPVAAGVILIFHGIQDLLMTPRLRSYKADKWWISLIFSLLSIVFGVLCIARAFGVVKLVMVIIGLMLIYDGLSDMVIIHKYNFFRKLSETVKLEEKARIREEELKEEERREIRETAVDADFREVQ